AYARELELGKVAELLEQTLDEEYEADDRLTDLAVGGLNQKADEASDNRRGLRRTGNPNNRRSGSSQSSSNGRGSAANKGSSSSNRRTASKSSGSKTASKKSAPRKSSSNQGRSS
ncbi:MAG: DUF892 family protein, partial [Chitinophagaceae bacterium]